jgi:hypothetical protein
VAVVEVQFIGSLPLPSADVDGLDADQLAQLVQDRVGHTGTVVLSADGPNPPLPWRGEGR